MATIGFCMVCLRDIRPGTVMICPCKKLVVCDKICSDFVWSMSHKYVCTENKKKPEEHLAVLKVARKHGPGGMAEIDAQVKESKKERKDYLDVVAVYTKRLSDLAYLQVKYSEQLAGDYEMRLRALFNAVLSGNLGVVTHAATTLLADQKSVVDLLTTIDVGRLSDLRPRAMAVASGGRIKPDDFFLLGQLFLRSNDKRHGVDAVIGFVVDVLKGKDFKPRKSAYLDRLLQLAADGRRKLSAAAKDAIKYLTSSSDMAVTDRIGMPFDLDRLPELVPLHKVIQQGLIGGAYCDSACPDLLRDMPPLVPAAEFYRRRAAATAGQAHVGATGCCDHEPGQCQCRELLRDMPRLVPLADVIGSGAADGVPTLIPLAALFARHGGRGPLHIGGAMVECHCDECDDVPDVVSVDRTAAVEPWSMVGHDSGTKLKTTADVVPPMPKLEPIPQAPDVPATRPRLIRISDIRK